MALSLTQGFDQAPEDYPALPVPTAELQALLDQFNQDAALARDADATARERHVAKDASLGRLTLAMKSDIRYAEVAMRKQPEKLSRIGWGSRREALTLAPPGEVRDIRVRKEGDTWLVLDWKLPVDGGGIAAYKVQRRKHDNGAWEDVATSVEVELLVSNQSRGVEFDFRVLGVNKAGTGEPSATVTVVL
ncbi:MAG: fibronectin type III domain-containing protein [Gemmatimonadetes bacterium]|nr:fibronectin type III domain-containing protein [Gemmatimonadota bacterium]